MDIINEIKTKKKLLPIIAAMILGLLLIIFGGKIGELFGSQGRETFGAYSAVYETDYESKIRNLCEKVNGVSNVTVVVSTDEKGKMITGVAIVCDGGNDAATQNELFTLISTACGIGFEKIYVTGT